MNDRHIDRDNSLGGVEMRRFWFERFTIIIALLLCVGIAMADPTTDTELLLAADLEFDEQTAERGIDGWVSFFAEHGSMHLSSGSTVVGHDAIRALMGPLFDDPHYSLRWQPTSAAILIPGQLGYTTGRYESAGVGEDEEVVLRYGSYVSMWKKQEDGSWKVVFDTGAEDE